MREAVLSRGVRRPAGPRADALRPFRRWGGYAAVGLAAGLLAAPLAAQDDAEPANPRVQELTFRGVQGVAQAELRESIATRATRCRSVVFYPFCRLTDSGLFKEKRFLDPEELRRDELRIRVFYALRGYREASVETQIEPDGDEVKIAFAVTEGPVTRVGSVEVRQSEPVLDPQRIESAGLPAEGEPLNLIEVDSARLRLLEGLWERGYGDAEVRDTVRLMDSLTAAVEVQLNPGRRTTVGEIDIRGNERVSDRTILRTMDVRSGQIFRRDQMITAQRRLFESELFRQALISVPEQADTAKRVTVTVQEAPFREVRLAGGLNTVEFVQTEARFTRFNWMGGARRLDVRAAVGNLLAPQLYNRSIFGSAVPAGVSDEVDDAFLQPTWQAGADLTQPFAFGPRNSFGVGVFAHRRSLLGIVVDRGYGGSASITRRLAEDVNLSAVYRFENTTVEAGDLYYCINFGVCRVPTIEALRQGQRLSPLGLTADAVRTDDPISPTSGYTVRADLEHASGFTASDFRYDRASGEVTGYWRLGRGVLAGRVRGGWVRPRSGTDQALGVEGAAESLLHPRKRFYSGGSRSVRGYGENQLGPRILTVPASRLTTAADTARGTPCTTATILDGQCDPAVAPASDFQPRPLGGNSVVEGNVEYRFPIWGALGGTVFVDAGSVGDRGLNIPTGARSAVTPGFGFRYQSPVGPVRIDLGVAPTLVEQLAVVTSVIDPQTGEARLVQLERQRRYDPLEGSSGFLRQVLARLQLHLSIGQAF